MLSWKKKKKQRKKKSRIKVKASFNLSIPPSSSSSSRLCVFACALMERQLHVGRPHEANVDREYWSERLVHHANFSEKQRPFIHSKLKQKIPPLFRDEFLIRHCELSVSSITSWSAPCWQKQNKNLLVTLLSRIAFSKVQKKNQNKQKRKTGTTVRFTFGKLQCR